MDEYLLHQSQGNKIGWFQSGNVLGPLYRSTVPPTQTIIVQIKQEDLLNKSQRQGLRVGWLFRVQQKGLNFFKNVLNRL